MSTEAETPGERLLVVDLAARSKNWALTPEGERRIKAGAPPGWTVNIIRSETSSDGDGPPRPSDEVMTAIREAEAYYGFGIPRLLFLEAKRLRWARPDVDPQTWCVGGLTGWADLTPSLGWASVAAVARHDGDASDEQ